jgi:NAD(P)-dependent dehydrogenase (short-subunit alcohol dehydrogenase family)
MTAESHTLNEQVVLITGAAQGLGKATALAFARRGAKLSLVDMNEASLNDTVQALHGHGAECLAIVADIAASGAARSIVQQTIGRFSRLDVLVNNACLVRPATLGSDRE